ncbi:MAG: phenylacetate--CoA ligase [Deltaproteobacteria bacterium]|nr:MAG: phenylacetate--CoA ligase [Deltaproteobacteria bacterium]
METMPREELIKLKEKKLPEAIKRAYASPFYQKRFKEIGADPNDIKTIDDLEKLPFTTKEDLRKSQQENPPFGDYSGVSMEKISNIFASSGTTGEPTTMVITRRDVNVWAERAARIFWATGLRPDDIAQNTYNYQLFAGAWMVQWGMEKTGATLISMGVGNSKRQLITMKRYGTTYFTGTPSYALSLAEAAEKEGIDIKKELKVRNLLLSGEPGSSIPSVREKIENLWGAKVHDFPGQSEALGWSGSCEEQCGCHIIEDHFIVEIVDPETKKRVGPGQTGVAVLTHLEREAQGLIRWWTNDLTYYVEDECPCGRTGYLLPRGLSGRSDDMLKVKGVRVWPAGIEEVLRSLPSVGQEFQIILDETNVMESGVLTKLKLRVESKESVKDTRKIEEDVITNIKARFNLTPEVEVVEPGTLPRFEMKAKRIIDTRKTKG